MNPFRTSEAAAVPIAAHVRIFVRRFIDSFPDVKSELLDHLRELAGILISVVIVPLDYATLRRLLPDGVEPGYDGLTIELGAAGGL